MTKELLIKEGFMEIPGVSKYMINPTTKQMRGVASGKPLSLKNGKTFQFLDDAKKYMNMTPEKVLALCDKKPSAKPVAKKTATIVSKTKKQHSKDEGFKENKKTAKEKTPRTENKAAEIHKQWLSKINS